MKIWIRLVYAAVVSGFLAIPVLSSAQPLNRDTKTGAPYFFVQSQDPDGDALPLKSTDVDVDIAGVIADVTVEQTYKNTGRKPLEAVYVFPASTRAAVYGMRMEIGERIIEAEIDKRKQARQAYEKAKAAGQSASLLEQQRPNVFQMNVANILPGDVIKVTLRYTENLVPENAEYRFVFPTVVGPRYTGPQGDQQSPAENWTANPHLRKGQPPTSRFDIDVHICAGMPIAQVACDTHPTDVAFAGKTKARVGLADDASDTGNRDFIVKYRLAGNAIETGMLLYEGEGQNYFLMMMQPPETVDPDEMPPREYLFIVDVSGSMNGFPLNTSKALIKDLIGGLKPTDRFNVLLFAGGQALMAEKPVAATPANIRRAENLIDRQRGGGGTQLLPALQKALDLPAMENSARTVVIATDGYVSVEKQAFDIIRNRLGDANLFAFGIGSSVNRYLIEGMARAGMGEPFVVTRPAKAPKVADDFRKLIAAPMLTDIEMAYEGFDAYDIEPPAVPDLFAQRPVVVFGKYRGKPEGRITVAGRVGDDTYQKTIEVKPELADDQNAGLRFLWARHRIAMLSDYNRLSADDVRIEEITRLGLAHNLLTRYTSFVAIDKRIRNKNGEPPETVRQPLPMPEGVSDPAAGRGSRQMRYAARPKTTGFTDGATKSAKLGKEREPDRRKNNIRIQIEEVQVVGAFSGQQVKQAIKKLYPALKSCISNRTRSAARKISIRLNVSANGRVKRLHFAGNALNAVQKACWRKVFQTDFSMPAGVVKHTIAIQVDFAVR